MFNVWNVAMWLNNIFVTEAVISITVTLTDSQKNEMIWTHKKLSNFLYCGAYPITKDFSGVQTSL